MKLNALIVAAAALGCAATTVFADSLTDQWLGQAQHQVDLKLAKGGIAAGARSVDLQMHVDGDGQLSNPRIVTTSGSRDTDAAIVAAVRRVNAEAPPAVLSGRTVVFHIGVAQTQTASLPVAPKP